MNDTGKTLTFVVLAVVLCGAAYLTRPSQPTLTKHFDDQGQTFYPEFTDPQAAASLEVIDFDADAGTAKPFKVELKDGVWSIPSHHNYPADGKDRLAKTAAGVIELRKDTIQSDRPQDHEALGVIDPLDDSTPTLKGPRSAGHLARQGRQRARRTSSSARPCPTRPVSATCGCPTRSAPTRSS